MKKIIAATAVAVNLIGCASVTMSDAQQDIAAKRFIAPKEYAAIYVYRNESIGAAVKMDVEVDGKSIGQTAAKTFLYKEVPAGKHSITSKAENTDTVEVDAKPGTLHYIWQEVKMGVMYARTKLHLIGEAEGKKGVMETKLAQTR